MNQARELLYLALIMMLMGRCQRLAQPQETFLMYTSYTLSGVIALIAVYYFCKEYLKGMKFIVFGRKILF